jgi:NAD(P)-dependent dehydrogenase (short-subunit alcohol dehydrogenase family)
MKSVLITGASTGIGQTCAVDLAANGWRVFAGVRRPADGQALVQLNSAIRPVLLDVCDPASIEAAVGELGDELGKQGLQALVNNAGIVLAGPLEYLPAHAFEKHLQVNLTGAFRVTQACLPMLRQAVEGGCKTVRVLMMSSISGRVGTPMVGAYNASKFGMEGMSDAWRRELLPHKIDVILIEPGAIATPIWDKSKQGSAQLRPELGADCESHYCGLIRSLEIAVDKTEARAIPTQKVADKVRHALHSPRPRVRYLIGKDAKMGAFFQSLLPTRWLDRLISKEYLKDS